MAWSRGAVVIVKNGDKSIGDAIESGVKTQMVPKKKYDNVERDYMLMKRRNSEFWKAEIQRANTRYGRVRTAPRIIKIIAEGFALIIYPVSLFWDKYLRIK